MKCAAAVMVLGTWLAPAQDWRQEWSLKHSSSPHRVNLRIERSRPGNDWSASRDVPIENLHGFSLDMLLRSGRGSFEYVHDAGRLLCQGDFHFGGGSGTFTFSPDPNFGAELKRLGYDAPADDHVFSLLMSDVSLEFARQVRDTAGATTLPQLLELRMHGATPEYLRELKSYGLQLDVPTLVQLQMHGVRPDFLRDAKRLGYNFTAKELVELRMYGVNGPYLQKLQDAGMRNLTAAQIAKLRMHGID